MSGHVDVIGVGQASGPPDVVTIDIRVQCDASDVGGALADASKRMAAVQAVARDRGIPGTDLQTTGSSVHPRWVGDKPKIVGYTASQSLRVRVRDIDASGDLVTSFAKVAGDALAVDNIALAIADPAPLAISARERAFADARAKAEQYAALAGLALGKAKWVSDLPVGGGAIPMPRMRAMAADSAMGMPVEAGEHTVEASVSVRWSWS